MRTSFPKSGEVWWVKIPKTGDHRIYGERPAIIVSHSGKNRNSPIIKIIPLSRYEDKPDKLNKSKSHTIIYANDYWWLNDDSIALCEQETPCDKEWFVKKLGNLNDNDLDKIAFIKVNSEPGWFMRSLLQKFYESDEFVYSLYEENRVRQVC